MFIGRERELATLNTLYASNNFEFVVIYGRRCVGKTALINQFIAGKKSIYFMSLESNEKYNLESFGKSIVEYQTGSKTASPKILCKSYPIRRMPAQQARWLIHLVIAFSLWDGRGMRA